MAPASGAPVSRSVTMPLTVPGAGVAAGARPSFGHRIGVVGIAVEAYQPMPRSAKTFQMRARVSPWRSTRSASSSALR